MAAILVDFENVCTTDGLKGVECGCLSVAGETQICIISKDKGFRAIHEFGREDGRGYIRCLGGWCRCGRNKVNMSHLSVMIKLKGLKI